MAKAKKSPTPSVTITKTFELPEGPTRVGITLQPGERLKLEELAAEQGIPSTTLARSLILKSLGLTKKSDV